MEINMKPNYIIRQGGAKEPKMILVFNYESTNSVEMAKFSTDINLDIYSIKPIARFNVRPRIRNNGAVAKVARVYEEEKQIPTFKKSWEVGELATKNNIPELLKKDKKGFIITIIEGVNFYSGNRVESKKPSGQWWVKRRV